MEERVKVAPTYRDLERAVAEVPGVAEASVGAVGVSGRGRLRIRLEGGHDPDAVSHAVSRTLRERFGIDIDPAAIRPRPADPGDGTAEDGGSAAPEPAAGGTGVTVTPGDEVAPAAGGTGVTVTPGDEVEPDAAELHAPRDPADADADADGRPDAEGFAPHDALRDADPDVAPSRAARRPDRDEAAAPSGAGEQADRPRATLPGVEELFRSTRNGPANGDAGREGNGHGGCEARQLTRPAISELLLATAGLELHAEAVLRLGDRELRGTASGAATRKAAFRSIASATLGAIEALFPGEIKIELEGIEVVNDGEDERVTVTVTFLTAAGSEKLVGVALSDGDPERATMRATLDAVNRRLGRLLLGASAAAEALGE